MGITVSAKKHSTTFIGKIRDILITTIAFDVSKQIKNFGSNGTFTLLLSQRGLLFTEEIPYQGNFTLNWDASNSPNVKIGKGQCQLLYETDTIISKSEIYNIFVTSTFGDE